MYRSVASGVVGTHTALRLPSLESTVLEPAAEALQRKRQRDAPVMLDEVAKPNTCSTCAVPPRAGSGVAVNDVRSTT